MHISVKAVIIKDHKVLLVKDRRNHCWSLPGGKPRSKESDYSCLKREVAEELSETSIGRVFYYHEFNEDGRRFVVYLARNSRGSYEPSDEIVKAIWTSWPDRYKLSGVTRKVVKGILEDQLI